MSVARLVLVTHPPRGAASFARGLVERRLAACVNLVPVGSVYRWRARVESARETLLVVKTSASRLAALERHVRSSHPYDTPEFVVLSAPRVEARYLRWLVGQTRPERRR
jgi:periplasmic divalent cation tolerance protein